MKTRHVHQNVRKKKKRGNQNIENAHIVMRIYFIIIAEIIKLLPFPLFCAVKKLVAHCECKKPKLGPCFSFVTAQDILDFCLHV
jgi:hypothetical protein